MTDPLRDRRILIVGGTSGLGLAVADLARARGAAIIVASRSAGERRAELAERLGPDVAALSLDAASPTGAADALAAIGTIDHLVVTTRPALTPAPLASLDLDQARQAFETKFWGTCRVIRAALPHLRPDGSIVLTSGIAGEKTYRNQSVMAALNGATEALCRSLAVELAPVRVNAVSPGFVAPKPPEVAALAAGFPLGRLADPEAVALAFLQLMENPCVTGTILVVDGGARLV